jgi:hypothetical protein
MIRWLSKEESRYDGGLVWLSMLKVEVYEHNYVEQITLR